MATQRACQLLADVYGHLVPDKAALAALSAADKPLRTYAGELAQLSGAPAEVLGSTQEEVEQTNAWLDRVDGLNGSLQQLDQQLEPRTFLSANAPTAADYSLFASLYEVVSTLPPAAQHAHPSLVRYFSHMSHLSAQSKIEPHVTPFEPAFDGFPKIQRADAKKEKAQKKAAEGKAPAAEGDAAAGGKAPKGEKPQKDKGGKGKGGGAAPPADNTPQPSMVDLRVGRIVEVGRHPDADSLYLEKVDFGEPDGPRTILSGLVKYVPMDQMQDRWVIGVCNLKPVAMRGIKSFGMILCASSRDGKDAGVEPILPPEGSSVGDRVYIEGFEGMEPLDVLNPKKKIFETIQPNYTTTDQRVAAWIGPLPGQPDGEKVPRVMRTEKGPCVAPTFANGSLS